MRRSIRQFVARSRRIVFVGVSLFAYLAAVFGFPLPIWTAKDRSVPFPCQDRPCGCRSAAECWQSCCCFTREEHLAWARANNVESPAGYATNGWNDGPKRQAQVDCCQPKKACCSKESSCPTSAACGLATKSCNSDAKPQAAIPARFAVGALYLKCRGLTIAWAQSGAALPAPAPLAFELDYPLAGLLNSESISAVNPFLTPPLPPPRWLA
jgi:hypothetical protein